MADLVVKDLSGLVVDLDHLISEFEGALDLQDVGRISTKKGIWGQLNANLSMHDFAWNWTKHRNDMVDDMKKLREQVQQVQQAWEQADKELADSLTEDAG